MSSHIVSESSGKKYHEMLSGSDGNLGYGQKYTHSEVFKQFDREKTEMIHIFHKHILSYCVCYPTLFPL